MQSYEQKLPKFIYYFRVSYDNVEANLELPAVNVKLVCMPLQLPLTKVCFTLLYICIISLTFIKFGSEVCSKFFQSFLT